MKNLKSLSGRKERDMVKKLRVYHRNYYKYTYIDDSDYKQVKDYSWRVKKDKRPDKYYVYAKIGKKTVYMHRFLLNPPHGTEVDHIDNNPLHNQRSNIRVCTHAENLRNYTKTKTKTTSKYKGVYYHKRVGAWCAKIKVNGKQLCLGYHAIERDAAMEYNMKAIEVFGKYANLNKVAI